MSDGYRVKLDGLDALRRKLEGQEMLAKPLRDGMNEAARVARDAIRAGAPRGKTGQLQAKLSYSVQQRPIPSWAKVTSKARRRSARYPSGYSYGGRLAFDPRSRHRDWMLRGFESAAGRIQAVVNRIGDAIEQRWRS